MFTLDEARVELAVAMDAMDLSGADFAAYLRTMGVEPVSALPHGISAQPQRPEVDPRVAAALAGQHEAKMKANAARAKTIAEDAIDARKVSPRDIEYRLRGLGIGDVRQSEFRPAPVPPPPVEELPPDPRADREARARRSLTHKILTAEAHHRPLNARGLSDFEFRELLRRRGLALAPVVASKPRVE